MKRENTGDHNKTKAMVLTALMAAILCIAGPLSLAVPFSPVPLSLATMAVCFSACILGWKLGTLSVLIYLLIGLCGLPVFSGFSGGVAKLAGPTGGYLIGYLFLAFISGWFFHYFRRPAAWAAGMVLGNAACYLAGTAWLCFQAHLTFPQGLLMGVIPYLPGDLVKMLLVLVTGPAVKKRLLAAGLSAADTDSL